MYWEGPDVTLRLSCRLEGLALKGGFVEFRYVYSRANVRNAARPMSARASLTAEGKRAEEKSRRPDKVARTFVDTKPWIERKVAEK
jgi:hypothetical protein